MLEKFTVYNGGVKLYFGPEVIGNLKKHLKGHKKLLIVSGKRSADVSGAFPELKKILDENGVEYVRYTGVKPNPTDDVVEEIKKLYLSEGCDGIVAIGGGSPIDSAKAARVLIAGGGTIKEYLYGLKRIPENQPPLYAINLTHGTGTEIDRYSVVTITETREKIGFGPGYPTASIDDPRYLVTLPLNQTRYTALDAFAHAVESSTSSLSSPYTRLLSREAIALIVKYLPVAVEQPRDLEARYWLLYASMIAGIAIDHGVTQLGHGLEHVLSGLKPELPHGAGLAILYKELIRHFYKERPAEMKYVLEPLDPSLRPVPEDADKAQEAFNKFLEKIGFDETLSTYGFTKEDVDEIVRLLYETNLRKRYEPLTPYGLPDKEYLKQLILKLL